MPIETRRFLARLSLALTAWKGIDIVPFTECLISDMSKEDIEEIIEFCNQQLKEKDNEI